MASWCRADGLFKSFSTLGSRDQSNLEIGNFSHKSGQQPKEIDNPLIIYFI